MFQIRDDTGVFGPYSGEQIKSLAMERRLHRGMEIRRYPDGKWKPIAKVKEVEAYLTPARNRNAAVVSPPRPLPGGQGQQPAKVEPERRTVEVAAPAPPAPPPIPHIDMNAASGQMVSTMTAMGRYYAGKKASSASHSLGISGLIIGVIGIFLFWAPFLGVLLGAIGLLMGIIGLILAIQRKGYGIGFSIGASALSLVAILMNAPASLLVLGAISAARDIAQESNPELVTSFDVDKWNELVARRNKHVHLRRTFRILACDLEESPRDILEPLTIYLKVQNATQYSVRRAYFHATLRTPGREIPWVDTDFNYEVPGGLAPGETAEWHLQPNLFDSDWEHARHAENAVLSVEVLNLDGPDGEYLYPEWSDKDERMFQRLRKLKGGC